MKTYSLLALFCLLGILGCQSSPHIKSEQSSAKITTLKEFSSELVDLDPERVIQSFGHAPNTWGYILLDPMTYEVVEQKNSENAFIPSSLNKIVPAYAALKILGFQHKFKTKLYSTGRIKKGVLKGSLYLKGGNDPFLTISDLMNIVLKLKRLGISRVDGEFYFDDTAFVPKEGIDLDRDLGAPFNPGLSSLSAEFNQAIVAWRTNKDPSILETSVTPDLPIFKLGVLGDESVQSSTLVYEPQLVQEPESPTGTSSGVPLVTEKWNFQPSTRKGGSVRIPVKHPGYAAAFLLKKLALLQGLELPDPKPMAVDKGLEPLFVYESLPLWELVGKGLEYSNNLMSELILAEAGARLGGKRGTLETAAKRVESWTKSQLKSHKGDGFVLANGSGLGSANRMSPMLVAQILTAAEKLGATTQDEHSFISMLPIMGWKGTLDKRHGHSKMSFRIWAKTGTQSYASALGGYLFSASGRRLVFALMATDFENREKLDALKDTAPKSMQKNASTWLEQARAVQDAVLVHWVTKY